MRKILISLFSILIFSACLPGDADLQIFLSSIDNKAAVDGETVYEVFLEESGIFFQKISLNTGNNQNEEILDENVSLQFINFEELDLGPDDTFNSLGISLFIFDKEVFNEPEFSVDLLIGNEENLMFKFKGVVTLTDGTTVDLSILLPTFDNNEAFSTGALNCKRKGDVSIDISLRDILSNIDFDTLGAGKQEIIIEEGTKDPEIDTILLQLQDNIKNAFQNTFQSESFLFRCSQ